MGVGSFFRELSTLLKVSGLSGLGGSDMTIMNLNNINNVTAVSLTESKVNAVVVRSFSIIYSDGFGHRVVTGISAVNGGGISMVSSVVLGVGPGYGIVGLSSGFGSSDQLFSCGFSCLVSTVSSISSGVLLVSSYLGGGVSFVSDVKATGGMSVGGLSVAGVGRATCSPLTGIIQEGLESGGVDSGFVMLSSGSSPGGAAVLNSCVPIATDTNLVVSSCVVGVVVSGGWWLRAEDICSGG